MNYNEAIELSGAILLSLGGGAGIIGGFSSWLGKVWADRLMQQERQHNESMLAAQRVKFEQELSELQATQARELERLRATLEHSSQEILEQVRTEWDVAKQKHLKGFQDKLEIYRQTANIIADLLGDIDHAGLSGNRLTPEQFDKFNRGRIAAYAYVGMIAPQSVMDVFDGLIDHLLMISHGQAIYVWEDVRNKALALLNEIRKDIGIDCSAIAYNGKL